MKQLIILICFPLSVFCQNTIGLPDVINYSKISYAAGLQNWDIKQDNNGIIYIANNEGLLSFDGRNWTLFPLPNKTIVRSVEIGSDHRIYVGGQDEIGYFAPSANGQLKYHSLIKSLPDKDRSFGDVWDIISFQQHVFFRSSNKIFKLTKDAIASYDAPTEWTYLGLGNGRLFAHDKKMGLHVFENNVFAALFVNNGMALNDPVTSIIPLNKDSNLVTTLKSGLFILTKTAISKLNYSNSKLFENDRIYAATKVNDEWIALATNDNGIYIIDLNGKIIQSFTRKEGLQNNNVLSIFLDRQGNLWLGLDNGIDLVAYNSAIKKIIPNLQDGSGYTAIIHKERLYIGTSNGLFSVTLQPEKDLSFSKGDFLPVTNTKGQTWGLTEINSQLLLGHHEGALLINENNGKLLSSTEAVWNFLPLSGIFPTSQMLAGNYNGLSLFDFKGGQFVQSISIPGFTESSRFVTIDEEDNIWVSHPYHGVYKISKNANNNFQNKSYTIKNGLPSTLNNHVYKIKNEVLVATENGIYTYNVKNDSFEPSAYYKKLLGTQSLRYLKEDNVGNIWFIHEKMLGLVDQSAKEPSIYYFPELTGKMVGGFEFIYPVDKHNIFLGGAKGFYHMNFEKYKNKETILQPQVRSVRIIDNTDSLLFGGYYAEVNEKQIQDPLRIPEINKKWKAIHIDFSCPIFGEQSNLEYSYRLKGFNETWSDWTSRTEKEYGNLPGGNYQFEVKVRNNLGNESSPSSYSFKILLPWYQTSFAKILYLIIFFSGIFALYIWQQKKFRLIQEKHEAEQKKLLYIHELELNKTESELVALRNEKLESEINFKNSELASSAMHLVKKGELLSKSKSELEQFMKALNDPQASAELKKLVKNLTEDDNMDKEWEHFAKHFDKVHSDFLVELKVKHPGITANELKLSAYLRMNLSTKEIAQLMNISVRGVEIGRYRLRKKLQIPTEITLFNYLISIQQK